MVGHVWLELVELIRICWVIFLLQLVSFTVDGEHDLATQWIQAYPCKTKTSQETQRSLQKFLEPERKPKVLYTGNSLEFGQSCDELTWIHCTSTPHSSETHGIAERAMRRIKEGTSAVLLQSGLDEKWWADSMECCCYLRHIQGFFVWWEDTLWKAVRSTI